MAIYAIGDVQGCFSALMELLKTISFNPEQDRLWFTGDLVSRGEDSLKVLRFIKSLGNKAVCVLGNHDLHCAASFYHPAIKPHQTLVEVLRAPDARQLCEWLRSRPLVYFEPDNPFLLVHAGILPAWDVYQAQDLSNEVEEVLNSTSGIALLKNMYGNQPELWQDSLIGTERYRFIINVFTRMRFCTAQGELDLTTKQGLAACSADRIPWFLYPGRKTANVKIIFGHWAALYENWQDLDVPNLYPVDSGCVWGHALTALRLDDEKWFCVGCA